jgi:tetratricopeptide (TPR) repeat protein
LYNLPPIRRQHGSTTAGQEDRISETRVLRMSERLQNWTRLRERWTGKWQIPLLLVALVALLLAVVTYRSPASKIPFEQVRDRLPKMIDRGLYTAAIESASVLLQLPEKTLRELAPVHAALARARVLRAEENDVALPAIGRRVIDSYDRVVESGFELAAEDYLYLGKANEWAGRFEPAVRNYERFLGLSPGPHLELRRRVVDLAIARLDVAPVKLESEIDAVLGEASDRPDLLAWGAEHKISILCDSGRCSDALELLDTIEGRLNDDSQSDEFSYLRAYAQYRLGHHDEAERALRLLRDGLVLRDQLYAKSGWLLGRVVLRDGGPQRPLEAMAIFRDVMATNAAPLYAAAAELGLAEANVMLQCYDDALQHYEGALRSLDRFPSGRVLDRGAVELSLTLASERMKQQGQLWRALQFAEQAASVGDKGDMARRLYLLERVAELKAALAFRMRDTADALQDGEPPDLESVGEWLGPEFNEPDADRQATPERLLARARRLLLESGELYDRMASMTAMDDERSSAYAWEAAQRIHESGDHRATIDAMRQFIEQRRDSPMLPRAFRLLGQAQQALGRYAKAIETYQENHRRFPRTPDAGMSLIPMAQCYIAGGKKYAPQAEETLRFILDNSDVFTPAAPEYTDALFLLGDLLNRSGHYERAIPILEEAMTRNPDDPRGARAKFLLGDCYHQSGLALEQDIDRAQFAGERERLTSERRHRLYRAAELFGDMVVQYEARDQESLSGLDRVYLRHARLYRADCLFELGEYERSLELYEQAAWIYRDTSAALAAYVQIINCHAFAGSADEASAALQRALYLVKTLPDGAFENGVAIETRQDWRRYFEWVGHSGLF